MKNIIIILSMMLVLTFSVQAVVPDNLVHYWDFDDGTNNVSDRVGDWNLSYSAAGTITHNVTGVVGAGVWLQSAYFYQKFNLGDFIVPNITMCMWINYSIPGGYQLLHLGNNNDDGYDFMAYDDQGGQEQSFYEVDGQGDTINFNPRLMKNRFMFTCTKVSNGTGRIYGYINGTQFNNSEGAPPKQLNPNIFMVNGRQYNDGFTRLHPNVRYDEISIWNTSLDPSYINDMYENYLLGLSPLDVPPEVTLYSPEDNTVIKTYSYQLLNQTFTANATYESDIANCSLWTNSTGTWAINQTDLTVDNVTSFNMTGIKAGSFVWNVECTGIDSISAFAITNRTIIVKYYNISNPVLYWSLDNESFIDGKYSDIGYTNYFNVTKHSGKEVLGIINESMRHDAGEYFYGIFDFRFMNENFTVNLWHQPENVPTFTTHEYMVIGNNLFAFRQTAASEDYRVLVGGVEVVDEDTIPLKQSNWRMITVTRRGDNVTLYVNGSYLNSGTSTFANFGNELFTSQIGVLLNNDFGEMDEISFYNYGLTDDQILQLFNEGNAYREEEFTFSGFVPGPIVTLDSPSNNSYIDIGVTPNITFVANVTSTAELFECYVWTNTTGTWKLNQSLPITGTSNVSSFEVGPIDEGYYVWNIGCNDSNGVINFGYDNGTVNAVLTSFIYLYVNPTYPTEDDNLDCTFNVTTSSEVNVSITWYNSSDNITWNNVNTYDYTYNNITSLLEYNTTAGTGSVTQKLINYSYWKCEATILTGLGDVAVNTSYVTLHPLTNLTLYLPLNETHSNESMNITFSVEDLDGGINCTVHINDTGVNGSTVQPISDTMTSVIQNISATGTYLWNMSCTAIGNPTPIYSENSIYYYDITKPVLSNYSDNSSMFYPEINDIITLYVNVSDNVLVDHCGLYVNFSDWTNIRNYTINASSARLTMLFNITSYFTANVSNVSWRLRCVDYVGNTVVGDTQYFEVVDITEPDVLFGPNNFFNTNNQTIVSSYLENATIDLIFYDPNLFQFFVNVTCNVSGEIHYFEVLDINTSVYNYTADIDLTGVTPQKCRINYAISDDHTKNKIKEYKEIRVDKGVKYNTYEKNDIIIKTKDNDLRDIDTHKKDDRYNYDFQFNNKKLKREFTLVSDHKIYYKKDSKYDAHFVVWNEETKSGNWIDFVDTNIQYKKYKVKKISDYEYDIEIKIEVPDNVSVDTSTLFGNRTREEAILDIYGLKDLEFESIGGTNIVNLTYYFYVGATLNATALNVYDNSSIVGACVNITTITGFPLVNESVCFVGDGTEIYQINGTSTACTGYFDSGNGCSNCSDGNYSTSCYALNSTPTYFYTNFTKPEGASRNSSLINITIGGSSDTYIVPYNCWQQDPLQFRYFMQTAFLSTGELECYDSLGGWGSVFGSNPFPYVNEISMLWNISGNISQAFLGEIPNGTYNYSFTHPDYLPREGILNVTNILDDFMYNTSESVVYIVARNIKTGNIITGLNITINNTEKNKISFEYSGNNTRTEFYLNSSNYTVFVQKRDTNISTSFEMGMLENKTITLYMPFYANFNLYDERTLEEFNISSADRISFLLFCENETISTIVNVTNFTTIIGCEYEKFKFVLDYGSTSYYRTFILSPDEADNVSVYLIDLTTTESIYNSFSLDDLLKDYDNPSIYIKKIVEIGTIQITADWVDVEDKVGAYLIRNHEYIIEIHSDNNPVRVMGSYAADIEGDKSLTLYDIGVYSSTTTNVDEGVSYTAFAQNISNDTYAVMIYNDTFNTTSSLILNIYKDILNGTLLYTDTINNASNIEAIYNITQYENDTIVAQVLATRNGVQHSSSRVVQTFSRINLNIEQYLKTNFLDWMFLLIITLIALMATVRTGNAMGLAVSGFSALFIFFGWFSLSKSMMALALLISILSIVKDGGKK